MSNALTFRTIFHITTIVLLMVVFGCSNGSNQPAGDDTQPVDATDQQPDDSREEVDVSETDSADATSTADSVSNEDGDSSETSDPPTTNSPSQLEEIATRLAKKTPGDSGYEIDEAVAEEIEALPGDVVTKLIPLLNSPDTDVARGAAMYLLIVFDLTNDELVEGLLNLMHREDSTLSHFGLRTVRLLPPAKYHAAGKHLTAMLKNEESTEINRSEAARLIAKMGEASKEWTPQLEASAANDKSTRVRSASLYAISRVAEPKRATAAYIQALQNDASANVRAAAALRLSQLERTADVGPAVASALADEDDAVVEKAVLSLSRMGAYGAAAAAGQLKNADPQVQLHALNALLRVGQPAGAHIQEVEKLATSKDQRVADTAAALVARFKPSQE